LSPQKIENSLLNLMLGDDAFQAALKVVRVQLQPGPVPTDPLGVASWAYFPVDALITMGSERSAQAAIALVGRHGGVFGPQDGDSAMYAHVMAPGLAYRVDLAAVHNDPSRYSQWLWHAAAATQELIGQMAQWSFCVQHHAPAQRLASWLLYCLAQSSKDQFHLHAMPPAMRQCVPLSPLGAGQAPPHGFEVREGFLTALVPHRLLEQACTCHQKIAPRKG
jgi:hypothetical protein